MGGCKGAVGASNPLVLWTFVSPLSSIPWRPWIPVAVDSTNESGGGRCVGEQRWLQSRSDNGAAASNADDDDDGKRGVTKPVCSLLGAGFCVVGGPAVGRSIDCGMKGFEESMEGMRLLGWIDRFVVRGRRRQAHGKVMIDKAMRRLTLFHIYTHHHKPRTDTGERSSQRPHRSSRLILSSCETMVRGSIDWLGLGVERAAERLGRRTIVPPSRSRRLALGAVELWSAVGAHAPPPPLTHDHRLACRTAVRSHREVEMGLGAHRPCPPNTQAPLSQPGYPTDPQRSIKPHVHTYGCWPVQADEEPVDTMPEIRESVKPKCAADFKDYEVSGGGGIFVYIIFFKFCVRACVCMCVYMCGGGLGGGGWELAHMAGPTLAPTPPATQFFYLPVLSTHPHRYLTTPHVHTYMHAYTIET